MAAFDSAFDSSFDVEAGGGGVVIPDPVLVGTLSASFPGRVSVVDPLVFDSASGSIGWYATVRIGVIDVSSRLVGALQISGGEAEARLASFSLIPNSVSELDAFDSAPVTIDLTLFRPGQTATYRRFTGRVETVDFQPAERLVSISCRDGYQERIKAIGSAAEAAALMGGLAVSDQKILPWNDSEPDPVGYFNTLLQTMRGSVAIDSSGLWRAIPWDIGSPAATFTSGDVLDNSVTLSRPNRADVPVSIVATLNHRFYRLHAAALNVQWTGVDRYDLVVDGLPTAPKSMIMAALNGASGWLIKGDVVMTEPPVGGSLVQVGPHSVSYLTSAQQAALTCQSFQAWMYRRWYQQVEVRYRVTINTGGASERDESITASIESTFDADAWETGPRAESSNGIYAANAPVVQQPKTGYEGLKGPWPQINQALDHYAHLTTADVEVSVDYVVALALRKAAAGARKQTIQFDRPLDPRWEIGSVLGVSAYGLSGTGQVVSFEDSLDHDTGEAISRLVLACPKGNAAQTTFSASIVPPVPSVQHSFTMYPLLNWFGSSTRTPPNPPEDQLVGFLFNVQPLSAATFPAYSTYDAAAPVYNQQFRIVMPGIPANVRDPLVIDETITATINIAGNGVGVVF